MRVAEARAQSEQLTQAREDREATDRQLAQAMQQHRADLEAAAAEHRAAVNNAVRSALAKQGAQLHEARQEIRVRHKRNGRCLLSAASAGALAACCLISA